MDINNNYESVNVELSYSTLEELVDYFRNNVKSSICREPHKLRDLEILTSYSVNRLVKFIIDDNNDLRKTINTLKKKVK